MCLVWSPYTPLYHISSLWDHISVLFHTMGYAFICVFMIYITPVFVFYISHILIIITHGYSHTHQPRPYPIISPAHSS